MHQRFFFFFQDQQTQADIINVMKYGRRIMKNYLILESNVLYFLSAGQLKKGIHRETSFVHDLQKDNNWLGYQIERFIGYEGKSS